MRGTFGRLCHGRERRPMEPYGVAAPFVRMLAAASLGVGAASGVLALTLGWVLAPRRVYDVPLSIAAIAMFVVAPVLRLVAGMLQPGPVPVTAWDAQSEASS